MKTVSQAPTDQAFVQNPYPFYDRARAAGAVVYWEDYTMPVATTHAAVNTILRDRLFGREPLTPRNVPDYLAPFYAVEAHSMLELEPPRHTRLRGLVLRAFTNRRFGREPLTPRNVPDYLAPFYAVEAHSMLELEPPRHTRLRGLVLRAFTNRRIKNLGPEIETLTHTLIDQFPDGSFDVLDLFCRPIPVTIIARLLGVPEAMAPDLLRWSNAMVMMYQAGRTREQEEAAVAATVEFVAFMRGYVDARRSDPRDDLISALIAAEEDGARLTTDEMITTCILLLNAGHEATVHTLGNAIKLALESGTGPVPETAATFVEEVLRFDPPLHLFTRWAYEDVEIEGHHFRRGDEVGLLLASAGRDASVYADAARFLPTRTDGPANLAFGAGLHFCVGAPLARLEMQIALPILFARCPSLTLSAEPRYADIYHFHGLGALRVSC